MRPGDGGPARPDEDRERIKALQADLAEHLAIYGGRPDGYAATVRLGLLREVDAVLSALGVGAPRRGGGEGRERGKGGDSDVDR